MMNNFDKIEELVKIINESKSIVFFGGAGVSCESGIPDFRSSNGLYQEKRGNISVEEILSHSFFINNPKEFFDFYKEKMLYLDAKPNPCHLGLTKLEEMGKLKAIITQNIDGLHSKANSKNVYELHGTVWENYCMCCNHFEDASYIKNSSGIPRCPNCQNIIKPKVVLYEEALDEDTLYASIDAIRKADTLIIGGTSLTVYPANSLIQFFRGKNLVVINKQISNIDMNVTLYIDKPIGEVFAKLMKKLDN